MQRMYYIGLDVHKRTISYCVKDGSGAIHAEGTLPATRWELDRWMKTLPQPWTAAMEATVFTGWIYDHLRPHAAALKVAHPVMLRAIAAAKKKNDRVDAQKICDCLRCDFLPECYMATTAIRERRRTLRYRNLLVRQMVQMKNKISMLLMEAGVSYNKQRLHKAGYFRELLATNPDIPEGLRSLLRLCRETVVRLQKTESALVRSLEQDEGRWGSNPEDLRIPNDLQHPRRSWDTAALLLADDLESFEVQLPPSAASLIQQVQSRQRNRLSGTWGTNPRTPVVNT